MTDQAVIYYINTEEAFCQAGRVKGEQFSFLKLARLPQATCRSRPTSPTPPEYHHLSILEQRDATRCGCPSTDSNNEQRIQSLSILPIQEGR